MICRRPLSRHGARANLNPNPGDANRLTNNPFSSKIGNKICATAVVACFSWSCSWPRRYPHLLSTSSAREGDATRRTAVAIRSMSITRFALHRPALDLALLPCCRQRRQRLRAASTFEAQGAAVIRSAPAVQSGTSRERCAIDRQALHLVPERNKYETDTAHAHPRDCHHRLRATLHQSPRRSYQTGNLPPAARSDDAEPDEDRQLLYEGQRKPNHRQVWYKGPVHTAEAEEEIRLNRFRIAAGVFAIGTAATRDVGGGILGLAFGGRACHPAARALPVSIVGARDAETEATA